jgi:putative methionine-R-sulfoxide reductase with GAF domain
MSGDADSAPLSVAGEVAADDPLVHLHALTDSTLTPLDVDALLVELLARVRQIVDADTAAVLLLDPAAGELVARAASGIEEEVRQGVRVPLGTGFAGRIAATRQAVRLDRVDDTTVTNPILWEKQIKTMLGVPLLRAGKVLGVMHVGRLQMRPFSDADVALLTVLAERVTAAIETLGYAIDRAAAALLERSLLPGRLPRCPGLEFATRYVATEGRAVGGDWYDLFTVPSGALWIVVGDVAGHGLSSAVVMGRIRSALRAYALIESSPHGVLDLVDRKVDHFEIETLATVSCAVLEPPYDTMTVAVAGHPPPVIITPGRPAFLAEVAVSPPIGTNWGSPRASSTIAIPPEAVVAFYTDGLVERRREVLDIGLERLRQAISLGPPNRVAQDIMRHVLSGVVPEDDIALVVMRRTAESTDH